MTMPYVLVPRAEKPAVVEDLLTSVGSLSGRPMGAPHNELPRVLVVDDEPEIHGDFDRCLAPPRAADPLDPIRTALFGSAAAPRGGDAGGFDLVHAHDGATALAITQRELARGAHFSVAFVDMRMPPGWTGAETIRRLWAVDADIQVVLCTAFSDFTWDRVIAQTGRSEGLHLLRKPFVREQVRRIAEVLAKKWQLAHTPANRPPEGQPR